MCSQEKGKGQPGAGRFFPFRRNAPAVLMNGFSLEAGLLLNALFATLFRDLQRVGACACHSIISLVHLKAFRSFNDVEHNTDLFCFTSFLHSLSNLTCLIYESLLHFFFCLTTVFVDTRLWKTKHPQKGFQNFRLSCMLLTDRIEIHQLQLLV